MRNTPAPRAAQGRSAKRRRKSIPSPDAANALTITDGADTIGIIVQDGAKHHLFDRDGRWLGAFPSRQAAMAAAPTTHPHQQTGEHR